MIGCVIDMMKTAGASPVVVVTGHRHEELKAALASEGWRRSSTRTTPTAISLIPCCWRWPAQTQLIISPVDVPMVDDATVARLLEADEDVVLSLIHI